MLIGSCSGVKHYHVSSGIMIYFFHEILMMHIMTGDRILDEFEGFICLQYKNTGRKDQEYLFAIMVAYPVGIFKKL